MTAIERIRAALSNYVPANTDIWAAFIFRQACDEVAMTEVLAHIDALEAENERLRAESEERLQNCAALVAEVERLRKDAERFNGIKGTP